VEGGQERGERETWCKLASDSAAVQTFRITIQALTYQNGYKEREQKQRRASMPLVTRRRRRCPVQSLDSARQSRTELARRAPKPAHIYCMTGDELPANGDVGEDCDAPIAEATKVDWLPGEKVGACPGLSCDLETLYGMLKRAASFFRCSKSPRGVRPIWPWFAQRLW
jgi:hypothetical protein